MGEGEEGETRLLAACTSLHVCLLCACVWHFMEDCLLVMVERSEGKGPVRASWPLSPPLAG